MPPQKQQVDNNDELELTDEEIKVLKEILRDRLWWDEAGKRIKSIGLIAGAFFAVLAFLAMWWPWITNIVQFFLKDVPK